MRIKQPPKKPREENLVPLINVVFLMLIFFLVAGSLRDFQARGIKPVEIHQARLSDKPRQPLLMNAQGQISINNQLVEADQLVTVLQKAAANSPDKIIFIVADKRLAASTFTDVLQAAAKAGVKDVRLVTQRKQR